METEKVDDFTKTCLEWYSFHLSHVDDESPNFYDPLWSECATCTVLYNSLNYTSNQGEFGLVTREMLDNLQKRNKDRAKLEHSYIRRGNVPQYVSIVSPMPVHYRPGTEPTSTYGESSFSVVTEDLLISAGADITHEDELNGVNYTDGVLDTRYRGKIHDNATGHHKLNGDIDHEECDELSAKAPRKTTPEGDMVLNEDQIVKESSQSLELNAKNITASDKDELVGMTRPLDHIAATSESENFNDMYNSILRNHVTGFSEDGLSKTEPEDYNKKINSNDYNFEYNDTLGHKIGEENGVVQDADISSLDNEYRSNSIQDSELNNDTKEVSHFLTDENNNTSTQVTFSAQLVSDTPSPSTSDKNHPENLKSILKNSDSDNIGRSDDINNESNARDTDILIQTKSVDEQVSSLSPKPTVNRREADLRSQHQTNFNISNYNKKKGDFQTDDDETTEISDGEGNSSDVEFYSSTKGHKKRLKPKKDLYSQRAKLKAPSQKLKKRTSESDENEEISAGDSTLLMEQILEQEKRLKEGMKPWLKGRLGLSQQNSRFEIPMDVRLLENMTPMNYLVGYCVISKRRKALYKHVFQRADKNRDGVINFTELEMALKDVHTGILSAQHIENIIQIVEIEQDKEFELKEFSAIAAFSERISCKDNLPFEMLHTIEGQRDVIESADFFAINWKLDGIQVNPAVKRILDAL